MKLTDLKIKIYADGADMKSMLRLNADPLIKGLTTNPTLMARAGVKNYEKFCRSVLEKVTVKPLSLEVFADDFGDMKRQAKKISGWGANVFVKIPITNSRGESSLPIISQLSGEGIKLNITAVMTADQAENARLAVKTRTESILSIFNGRIMDTGSPPIKPAKDGRAWLWASTREAFNIWQADAMGYDIITVPDAILAKAVSMQQYDLAKLSLETVGMFRRDAETAGFRL